MYNIMKDYIYQQFDLKHFTDTHFPIHTHIDVPEKFKSQVSISQKRLNHYLIKNNDMGGILFGEEVSYDLIQMVTNCLQHTYKKGFPVRNRYVYLTYDNKPVKKGEYQRADGWHFDGMQGDEVPVKHNACYQYIACNIAPFEYALQNFKVEEGISGSIHNLFNYFGNQVKDSEICSINTNKIYLMTPYLLHRVTKAPCDYNRQFFRLYITHTPITSVKATINTALKYNYQPHTTSGNIPDHLI